jgi:hypothetical protein
MIAHQQYAAAGFRHLHDAFDNAARIKAAIDEIAQENDGRFGGWPRFFVRIDGEQQSIQTIAATVNVADRIDALTRWQRKRLRHGFGTGEEFFENHGFENGPINQGG